MQDYDYTALIEATVNEVVTRSWVRDVTLPSGRILALITLDNGQQRRPNTLGPRGLLEFAEALDTVARRAEAREISGVAVIGTDDVFAAGADLGLLSSLTSRDRALEISRLGHAALSRLGALPVPSFAFINGTALGGGLEVALHAHYRTVRDGVRQIALPETYLGLIPGWGGAFLLPNLIGVERAVKVIVTNPARNNTMLSAHDACELGIVDVSFPTVRFLEDSLAWADAVIGGASVARPHRPGRVERTITWEAPIALARTALMSKGSTPPTAALRALDLVSAAHDDNADDAFRREDDALADHIMSDQFRASMYGFTLLTKHSKQVSGAPDRALARSISRVGIVGAGLMASQFALLFLQKMQVPVMITDVSAERLESGIAYIHEQLNRLVAKGALTADERARCARNLSATIDIAHFAPCDLVIEAVFEELSVKRDVFRRVEGVVSSQAILATNTSSLSLDDMAEGLAHPERLVGIHFFNPVAVMPLVEVVRGAATDESSVATAITVAQKLGKSPIVCRDVAGFVVNRILAVYLGEALKAAEAGASFEDVIAAVAPLGLPMDPFALMDLIGITVSAHLLDSLHAFAPTRMHASSRLHELAQHGGFGKSEPGTARQFTEHSRALFPTRADAPTVADIYVAVTASLANETHIMMEEKVVHGVEEIDLAMLLGARWPLHLGGLTPYLDRCGASERAFGATFHSPPICGA
ncbi:3-hydroxyacyl-CoA dehydrogenase [Microbacteriaceae bacterium MWH-Ta3]|nr:3-hydroxyacyl-CoA dehydrogenase [Microbacteriaceae bacterium MWH-Ta3]